MYMKLRYYLSRQVPYPINCEWLVRTADTVAVLHRICYFLLIYCHYSLLLPHSTALLTIGVDPARASQGPNPRKNLVARVLNTMEPRNHVSEK